VRAPRVLFVTVLGPGGQVDVAAREDVTLGHVVAAVADAIGSGPQPTPLAIWRAGRGEQAGDEHIAVNRTYTLAEAGALDGDILALEELDARLTEEAP
jgi:hypothetical protein